MNNKRRNDLRASVEMLKSAYDMIDSARDEEQDCYDNIPENLQDSDRGCEMESNIDIMESALSDLDDVIENIEEII